MTGLTLLAISVLLAGIYGYSQQFCLVGRNPADCHADIAALRRKQDSDRSRRSEKAGNVLARPAALSHRHERLAMEAGGTIEIESPQRPLDRLVVVHSTVRRAPSGKVILTPRR